MTKLMSRRHARRGSGRRPSIPASPPANKLFHAGGRVGFDAPVKYVSVSCQSARSAKRIYRRATAASRTFLDADRSLLKQQQQQQQVLDVNFDCPQPSVVSSDEGLS